jgi:hypothetical protein
MNDDYLAAERSQRQRLALEPYRIRCEFRRGHPRLFRPFGLRLGSRAPEKNEGGKRHRDETDG